EDRCGALRDRAVRRVLCEALAAPRRGRVGVLRHRSREIGVSREGRGALPEARGRAVHRAVLETRPGVARGLECGVMGERGDKTVGRWRSERLEREVTLVRW